MSSFTVDKNLVYRKRAGTTEDPFVFITQTITILQGQATLQECPDSFQGITIALSVAPYTTYYTKEINNVEYNEVLPDISTFVYDAEHGILYGDTSFNNQSFTVTYYGTGTFYLNSDRVYTTVDENGDITQTLQQLIDTSAKSITFHTTAPESSDGENGDIWFVYQA